MRTLESCKRSALFPNFMGGPLHPMRAAIFALLMLFATRLSFAQSSSPPITAVDFENLSGPSLFSSADPPLTTSSATFSGGQLLTNATYLPADPTSVYGTSYFCTGCSPEISIDFAQKVSNFSVLLLNGQTFTVTYTVEDDQGGTTQTTLVANSLSGAAIVQLPESGIRQVVISSGAGDWDFFIDNVQFSPSSAALLDPVGSEFLTKYPNGASITTDVDVLASGGTLVQGVAADGVTQVLVRIPASAPGDTFALSLQDENGDTADASAIGGLFQVGDVPKNAANTLTVTAAETVEGPIAFAVYLAPANFSRDSSDFTLANRAVTLTVQVGTATQSTTTINVLRPPVVLIHGLWADLSSWSGFTPLVGDSLNRFSLSYASYSDFVSGITETSPSYPLSKLKYIRANALGFAYNAAQIEKLIRSSIADFESTNNVAAVQADIVGHSMGGDISRSLASLGDFSSSETYGQGIVDKLITIGTPHLGSPLAINLLDGSNFCTSAFLALNGNPSFTSVTINSVTVVSGAVNDLQGTGDGSNLSPALMSLKATRLPFPLAYIAATSTSTNLSKLGQSKLSASYWLGHFFCSSDPIAQALTPTGWPALFNNAASDSVVTLNSQLNGNATGSGGPFTGIIHSAGLESLNFSPPAEQDSASQIATEVVSLLNEAKSGPDFLSYGGSQ
jgi:pimeloyl-ACP methyl ester carboxylesterase